MPSVLHKIEFSIIYVTAILCDFRKQRVGKIVEFSLFLASHYEQVKLGAEWASFTFIQLYPKPIYYEDAQTKTVVFVLDRVTSYLPC